MKNVLWLLPLLVVLVLAATVPAPVEVPSSDPVPQDPVELSTGMDEAMRIPVGGTAPDDAPPASIALWIVEPRAGTPIRGTVLFLHGFLANHLQVENAGDALRNAGYRAVLIDARGFGESTGSHITFGVTDSRDLSQIITVLQNQKLCGKRVGVYGTSMGAATAILLAGSDPRVAAVVAVAPFASIREEVTPFSRNALGTVGSYLTDNALNSVANVVSDLAGLDLDNAKPIEAIAKTKASVLLIHGDADTIIPHSASEKLHERNPSTELLTIPNRGHLELCFDFPGQLQPATRKWFDQHLAPR